MKPLRLAVGSRLELARIDKGENAARFYVLEVEKPSQLGLFESGIGLVLVRAWGRIGNPPQVKRETFLTLEELAKRWDRVRRTRERHGYADTRSTSCNSPGKRTAGGTAPTGTKRRRAGTRSGSGDGKRSRT